MGSLPPPIFVEVDPLFKLPFPDGVNISESSRMIVAMICSVSVLPDQLDDEGQTVFYVLFMRISQVLVKTFGPVVCCTLQLR